MAISPESISPEPQETPFDQVLNACDVLFRNQPKHAETMRM